MSMPKGYKVDGGYATVGAGVGGAGYREIAEKMTEEGCKMNHSTARNVFLAAMKKMAKEMCELYDVNPTEEKVTRIASDPRFQDSIHQLLRDTGCF